VLAPDFVYAVLGEKRWASLRPEAIHVVKATAEGVSRLTGTVLTRSYQGPTTRLGIDLNGTVIHAVVPSADDVPPEGERVSLGFAKDALHLMENEA
jgi:putative spermidine/putrescine transport system ATP-binding protein